MSKSATESLRAGIGGEKKRGISTSLFRRPGGVRDFVAKNLDNLRRRGPREGRCGPGGARSDHFDDRGGPAGAPPEWAAAEDPDSATPSPPALRSRGR